MGGVPCLKRTGADVSHTSNSNKNRRWKEEKEEGLEAEAVH